MDISENGCSVCFKRTVGVPVGFGTTGHTRGREEIPKLPLNSAPVCLTARTGSVAAGDIGEATRDDDMAHMGDIGEVTCRSCAAIAGGQAVPGLIGAIRADMG